MDRLPDPDERERLAMVAEQIAARGVADPRVLAALRRVPRHLFVPAGLRHHAHEDRPLPIGLQQTISQPYIVGYMTEALHLRGGERVLEIGTGCGYQTAVLAEVVGPGGRVVSLEIVSELHQRAQDLLARLDVTNVELHAADGSAGWPAAAPYDAILVTAAPATVPPALEQQLAPGGRLLLPVGDCWQELVLIERRPDSRLLRIPLLAVSFVPMTGAVRDGGKPGGG